RCVNDASGRCRFQGAVMVATSELPGEVLGENPLWLDVENPTAEEMDIIARRFGFHPLSVEDALDPRNQRPKLDQYDTYRFLVFYGFSGADELDAQEINIFWASDYVVTVRHGPVESIAEARRRWSAHERGRDRTSSDLLHVILDTAVDSVLPLVDDIAEQVEELEDQVFARPRAEIATRGQQIRRRLLGLRRVLGPERDVIVALRRDPLVEEQEETIRYFDDVFDHVSRAADAVDLERDMVTSVMETYLTAVSNNLNEVMKTLTIAATILMTMSLVTGIYGMNFDNMPELDWALGYPFALGVMVAAALALVFFFRRRRWL
ncbi:MAG TPA: magnesium/cobalt transporter CorA, partial [Dehalococcoidia bacterium]|nr:magnesium/cobalt transporter CorA [Dehalococcoidia bacterium]